MNSFPLPLAHAPILVQSGVGRHGNSDGPTVERWCLPQLWCLHFYHYSARLEIGDEEFSIVPGSVALTPPNISMSYNYESRVEHLYAHFSLGPQAMTEQSNGKYWFAPNDLSPDFGSQMECLMPPHGTLRAQVVLWELLWRLSAASPPAALACEAHPALQRALALIEARLESVIGIADLAREVELSHNHLTRLCVAYTGQTVAGYVRARRAERARHLLRHSTLPIKTIAEQVGVPVLGQFNHLMHAQTGLSPSAIRARK